MSYRVKHDRRHGNTRPGTERRGYRIDPRALVVRVLLRMDARIHALEQQVLELTVRLDASEQRVKLLED